MIKISQSIINDLSDANMCPQYIKFKYIEGREGIQTDAMLAGNYFEYHVLGDTRDHKMPVFQNVNRKNLKPTKSRPIKAKVEYLTAKGYAFNATDDLDAILESMPEDLSDGEPCSAQVQLNDLVIHALNILFSLGIEPEKGESQVRIATEDLQGHIDHINADFQNPDRMAIYDLKYTETKETDKWNGWTDFMLNVNAHTQALHYIKLYHAEHGEYLPFYFLVFGKSLWVKVFKITVTEEGMSGHDYKIQSCKDQFAELERNDFPAAPKFNKCVKCAFYESCKYKSTVPEVEDIIL